MEQISKKKKNIIFIQGTDVLENPNQFNKIFENFQNKNYNVIYFPKNYSLPQNQKDFKQIDELKQSIIQTISKINNNDETVTLIGHSYGGLILNSILNKYYFENIDKIITIATFHKLKPILSQRIKNILLFKSKEKKLQETKDQLNYRKQIRKKLNYKDISTISKYKNKCYTIGFSLDPIVPSDSTKMLYSKHKIIMAEHGLLFRKSDKIINEIIDFCEL